MRLTVRAAFEVLLDLASTTTTCCICGDARTSTIELTCLPRIASVRLNICGAICAYELGKRTMPALELLGRDRTLRAVPSDGVPVRGASSRPTHTPRPVTRGRRKNITPAPKAAKRRG